MTCNVKILKKPHLNDPILLEGLPGIGLIANTVVAYIIKKFRAQLFAEIHSDSFPDLSLTDKCGSIRVPFCKIYYQKMVSKESRDLILVHGNAQALTSRGQYKLCSSILDVAESLGCRYVITLGGYRPGKRVTKPNLYFATSNHETVETATNLGAEILRGQIYGVAGLLVGLAELRNMNGLCLLAETAGTSVDVEAARAVLCAVSDIMRIEINCEDLRDAEKLADFLAPFDFGALAGIHKKKASKPDWFI